MVVYCGLLWFVVVYVVYCGLSWFLVAYGNVCWWFMVVYNGYVLIYGGLLLFMMVYDSLLCFIVVYCALWWLRLLIWFIIICHGRCCLHSCL